MVAMSGETPTWCYCGSPSRSPLARPLPFCSTAPLDSFVQMASTVYLHVGQCGNQVGEVYWRRASKEYGPEGGQSRRAGTCPLFHEDGKATGVFVDSESKVVNRLSAGLRGVVRSENVCHDSSGRANNWAMGFACSARELAAEKGLFYSAVEAVRREMERVDCVQSLVMFHSIAGGTGSGVGSALLQYLRDTCPNLTLMTCSVGPLSSGECPTQWYNATLSLQYLTELADVIVYRENDASMSHCLKAAAHPTASQPAQVTMASINESLAADLASILFPLSGPSSRSILRPFDAAALAQNCAPFTYAKYVDVRSTWSLPSYGGPLGSRPPRPGAPQPEWSSIVKALTTSLPTRDISDTAIRTLAAQACLRGLAGSEVTPPSTGRAGKTATPSPASACLASLSKSLHPVGWQKPFHPEVVCSIDRSAPIKTTTRSVAVCANRTQVRPLLGRIASRSLEMLDERAYQHWYSRYGVEDEDFQAAVESVRRVGEEYQMLAADSVGCTKLSAAQRRIRDA